MRLSSLSGAALLAAGLFAGAGAEEEGLAPGFGGQFTAALSLTDLAGAPLARPVAGQPFRVRARLADPASGQPLRDWHLAGWIRPVAPGDGPCREAARAYFAAGRVLSRGQTDLDRALYAARHADGTVSIVDWEHSLASANILALVRLPGMDGPLAAAPALFAFLAPLAGGGVARIDAAAGADARVLPGPPGPAVVAPNGWIARGAVLMPPDGGPPIPLGARIRALAPALPDAEGRRRGVVALVEGGAALVVEEGGRARPPVAGPPGATDVAHAARAEAVLFADGGSTLGIVYGGARRIAAPLPAPASRVSVDRAGRHAIAWAPGSAAVSILDVATGAVIQAVELNRPPVAQPVREVAFAEGAAFLLLDGLDFVMVIDLAQAARGEPAAVRAVRIGPRAERPSEGGPYLVETDRGYPGGTVLALHPDLATAFPVMRDSGGAATAPMNGFRLRGARPLSLAELSGGLAETAPGLYAAASVLATGGPHELIVSGGPGRATACARFEVEGPAPEAALALSLEARAVPGAPGELALELRLLDAQGVAQEIPMALPLALRALDSGWRARVTAAPGAPRLLRARVPAPPPGEISVALDADLGPEVAVAPTTLSAP